VFCDPKLIIVVVALSEALVALGSVVERMEASLAVVRLSMGIHGFACCEVEMEVGGGLSARVCLVQDPVCAEVYDLAIYFHRSRSSQLCTLCITAISSHICVMKVATSCGLSGCVRYTLTAASAIAYLGIYMHARLSRGRWRIRCAFVSVLVLVV
jgi:hypothetical protein